MGDIAIPKIAIKKYPGPVWLSHGKSDPLWPVDRTRRLEASRGKLPTTSHYWNGEGHIVQSPDNVQQMLDSLVDFTLSTAKTATVP